MSILNVFFSKTIKNVDFFFIRSSKLFVKNRYSRTRQWSKVIVFMSMFFNSCMFFYFLFFSYKMLLLIHVFWLLLFLTYSVKFNYPTFNNKYLS